MKIADTKLELQAVLSIVCNAQAGRERVALRLLGECHTDYFGYKPCLEIFQRLRRLSKKNKTLPTLRALRTDSALTEAARELMADPPVKPLKRESDVDLLLEGLQQYRKLRLIRSHEKELNAKLSQAKGIHDIDFSEIESGQEKLLTSLKQKTDVRRTLLHAGTNSNSLDLTKEILSDEDDSDVVWTGFDYFDKKSGGFRRGQFLVLASHRKGGKCVHESTLIETERGLIPIGELFDGTEPDDTFVPTKVKIAHRYGITHTSQRLAKMHDGSISIQSERGYELTASKVHPVLVLDPHTRRLDYKTMENLRKGDCIVLNKKHHIFPTKALKIDWKYQPTKYHLGVELPCAYCDYRGTGLSKHLHRVHPRVNRAAYLRTRHPEYKHWPQNRKDYAADVRVVPSHMTEDLAKVLGYLVAEGSSSKALSYCGFHQSDVVVFKDFCDAFKRCFPNTPLQIKRGACNVAMVRSSYVCKYLQHLGLVFAHSREKDVPWSIMRSTRSCVQAFLRAYYEGDGGVEGNHIVMATSASEKLIKNLQQLLLRFSIVTRRGSRMACATNGSRTQRKYHHLSIRRANAAVFAREIGFVSARKNAALEPEVCVLSEPVLLVTEVANSLKAKHSISSGTYRLPSGESRRLRLQPPYSECYSHWLEKHPALLESISHYEPKFVEGIREVLEQDFVLDPIVKITRSNKPIKLYDLSVPASHSYVANGMVVHNSITAMNMAFNQYVKYKMSVSFVPLEMGQKEIRQRLMSKLTGIPFEKFYNRQLSKHDKKKALAAWEEFEEHGKKNGCTFSTWKPEAATVEELVFQLKPYRYDVVYVDYVNLLRSSDPKQMGSNDWQMLSSFYKQLKEAASIMNCLMVGLTQTNTEGGIKYSSAALEDCDCAITWKFLEAEQAAHQLKAKVEVARNFPPFDFLLTEDFKHMSVSSYAGPPPTAGGATDPGDTFGF